MDTRTTPEFWRRFATLPLHIQLLARENFKLFKQNPSHPSLHFKPIKRRGQVLYSARIGIHYRALAYENKGTLFWFWIGHHTDYDKII